MRYGARWRSYAARSGHGRRVLFALLLRTATSSGVIARVFVFCSATRVISCAHQTSLPHSVLVCGAVLRASRVSSGAQHVSASSFFRRVVPDMLFAFSGGESAWRLLLARHAASRRWHRTSFASNAARGNAHLPRTHRALSAAPARSPSRAHVTRLSHFATRLRCLFCRIDA